MVTTDNNFQKPRPGGGLTSIIKVYTDVQLDGVYFSGLQVYESVSFSHQKYQWGFTKKVYEWVKFENEWVQFSLWNVYEWVWGFF